VRLTNRFTVTLGGLVVSAALLSGCSTPATSTPATEPTPLPEGVPPAPEPTAPSTESGPLQQADLPTPEALGDGWEYRVDPGSVEDGYAGSGAPAIAREPQDVVAAVTPLGCRPDELPAPTHALEVTYQRVETPAVALLLEFANSGEAQEFFQRHTDVLRKCVTSKQIDISIDLDDPDQFISERTEKSGASLTWTEGIAPRESQVLLVAVGNGGESETVANALSLP